MGIYISIFQSTAQTTAVPAADSFRLGYLASPIDTEQARYIALMLMDTSLVIGEFESPEITAPVHSLRSTGVIPEAEPAYMNVMMSHMLTSFYTLHMLQGEVDSAIFLPMPVFDFHEETALQIMNYPGTHWVLFLHHAVDAEGNPKSDWVRTLKKEDVQMFINRQTAFDFYNTHAGNICTQWLLNFTPSESFQSEKGDVVFDLDLLLQQLKMLPLPFTTDDVNTFSANISTGLTTNYGKVIGKVLIERLMEKL